MNCSTCFGALSGANSKRKVPRSVVTTASLSAADRGAAACGDAVTAVNRATAKSTGTRIVTIVSASRRPSLTVFRLEVDQGREGFRVEACAADQAAVDFRLRHQTLNIVGLNASAVKDPDLRRGVVAELRAGLTANDAVRIGGDIWGGCFAGPDGPDGLVRDHDLRELLGRETR